jgi:hypothetical protein
MFDVSRLFSAIILGGLLLNDHINVHALPTPTANNNTQLHLFMPRSSSKVTGKDKNTFYQAVYGPELTTLEDQVKNVKNPHPRSMKHLKGDFNADNTPGFYMWDNFKDADAWCELKKNKYKNGCKIAKFEWDPPSNLKLYRFESADDKWKSVSLEPHQPLLLSKVLFAENHPFVSLYGGTGIPPICVAERLRSIRFRRITVGSRVPCQ